VDIDLRPTTRDATQRRGGRAGRQSVPRPSGVRSSAPRAATTGRDGDRPVPRRWVASRRYGSGGSTRRERGGARGNTTARGRPLAGV